VRRIFGIVLVGVGLFLLAMTILLPTVVVDRSKKTPLDLNITQISTGPAKLFDASTGKTKTVQLRATRYVKTNSHLSDGKNTTVVETLCIVVDEGNPPNCVHSSDPRLLSITTDQVTADRVSAESVHVNGWGENVNGDYSVRHTGVSYKFPIDTKKKTYQFYLPDLKKAFPATFIGTGKIRGLDIYKFESKTGDQPYKIQGVADGTYNDTRIVWVEPQTGAIIFGTEHQIQTLADGTVALDTTLTFTKGAIDYQANYAKDKINQLRLAQLWGPIVCGILGVAALVGAYFLLRRRSGRDDGGVHRTDAPAPDDEPNYASSQT
jgi:hypothetical protein